MVLFTTPSFATPAKPIGEFQVTPLAGTPRAISGQAPTVRVRENRAIPSGGWIETGPGDRALIWIRGEPGCQFILEPEGRVKIKGEKKSSRYIANLDHGTLRSAKLDCGAVLEVATPVGRLVSHGAYFTVQAADSVLSVFHLTGDLHLLFRGQAIPLRAHTITTVSRSGGHRIVSSLDIEERTVSPVSTSSETGEQALPLNSVSPVSVPGRP